LTATATTIKRVTKSGICLSETLQGDVGKNNKNNNNKKISNILSQKMVYYLHEPKQLPIYFLYNDLRKK